MEKSPEPCKVVWRPNGVDWKLKLSGECGDVLKQIEGLPARRRAYLKRRIEVEA